MSFLNPLDKIIESHPIYSIIYNYLNKEGIKAATTKQLTEINIDHIQQDKKIEFLNKISAFTKASIIEQGLPEAVNKEMNDRFPKKPDGSSYKFEDLKEEKIHELRSNAEKKALDVTNIRTREIFAKKSFYEIFSHKTIIDTCFNPLDLKDEVNYNYSLTEQQKKLRTKINEKKIAITANNDLELLSELCSKENQDVQIKWYRIVAKKLNKPVNELTDEDLLPHIDIFKKLINEDKNRKSRKMEAHLLSSELTKKEPSPRKRNRTRKKQLPLQQNIKQSSPLAPTHIESTPTKETQTIIYETVSDEEFHTQGRPKKMNKQRIPLKDLIAQINSFSYKPIFTLDDRILRWQNLSKIEDARNFVDYDSMGSKIMHYKDRSIDVLKEMVENHNLVGIEKLLSEPEFLENYTESYIHIDKNKIPHYGRSIFVFKNKTQFGVIHLGINANNVIYHAQFKPFHGTRIMPHELATALEEYDVEKIPFMQQKNSKVNQKKMFAMLEDDAIEMKIGANTTYEFRKL